MRLNKFIVYFVFLFISAAYGEEEVEEEKPSPTLTTPLGDVKGYYRTSFGGRTFSAFEGIPYAKPPLGKYRFQETEPVEPWVGVWDATHRHECLQTGTVNQKQATGQEDCLYINVYVPLEKFDEKKNLEVIVHIHGGSFLYGSGHTYSHPEYFMDRDVVFVTFNYRLGIFGFLSTGDAAIPGNAGLKDQVLALEWVQKNIASFGGNPDSVTLTGLSAGGASVHYHYLSPRSKGLFHRGFSQSGVALMPWALQEQAYNKAKILAISMGCPISPSRNLVECLQQRPVHQILTKTPLFFGFYFTPIAPFAPVIEKGGLNPFLTVSPYFAIVRGDVQDLPWVVSNVPDEGMFPGLYMKLHLETLEERWNELAPALLDFNTTLSTAFWKETAIKIKEFYLGEGEEARFDPNHYGQLLKMLTDRLYLRDSEIAVRLQAKYGKGPVYYYHFNYPGDNNEHHVISHGDDGQYFFYKMYNKDHTENELKMKDVMIDFVVNYAKTGKVEFPGVSWDPVDEGEELVYLNITGFKPEDMKLQRAKELSPKSFWGELNFLENRKLVLMKDEL